MFLPFASRLKPWQITRSPPIFFVLDYTVCLFDNNLVRDHVSRGRGGLFVFNACYATVACRSVLVINLHLMRYKWASGIISLVNSSLVTNRSCLSNLSLPLLFFFLRKCEKLTPFNLRSTRFLNSFLARLFPKLIVQLLHNFDTRSSWEWVL